MNQKEIENLNRSITRKDNELIKNHLPTKKSLGPDGFNSAVYQKHKKLIPIFHKLFLRKKDKVMVSDDSLSPELS